MVSVMPIGAPSFRSWPPPLLGPIIAWGSPFVNPLFPFFQNYFFPGAAAADALILYIFPASAILQQGLFSFLGALGGKDPG